MCNHNILEVEALVFSLEIYKILQRGNDIKNHPCHQLFVSWMEEETQVLWGKIIEKHFFFFFFKIRHKVSSKKGWKQKSASPLIITHPTASFSCPYFLNLFLFLLLLCLFLLYLLEPSLTFILSVIISFCSCLPFPFCISGKLKARGGLR